MAKLIYASNMVPRRLHRGRTRRVRLGSAGRRRLCVHHELTRSAGTCLYGRRMYETLVVWETNPTLAAPATASTRLERRFDPNAVHDLKGAASRDLLVGGPNLAAQALVAGLVDELALFIGPVLLSGRNPALPTGTPADLELIDKHRFSNGVL